MPTMRPLLPSSSLALTTGSVRESFLALFPFLQEALGDLLEPAKGALSILGILDLPDLSTIGLQVAFAPGSDVDLEDVIPHRRHELLNGSSPCRPEMSCSVPNLLCSVPWLLPLLDLRSVAPHQQRTPLAAQQNSCECRSEPGGSRGRLGSAIRATRGGTGASDPVIILKALFRAADKKYRRAMRLRRESARRVGESARPRERPRKFSSLE